ncbi:MAG: 2,3-bisphosphoglycerate-independent phosphoglycerate mutase [Gammaproteobacteria bacterium]|nr:MAG: 2,3-bisphosphoglycerate-independent phosphoglycerate mutase [Gammaproteobacteria bacterium]
MYKGLLIILDGLGDRPSPSLNGLTPLQAANIPVMDELAAKGSCGLVDPLYPGMPVDTHTGCGALMGMPRKDLLKLARGSVEAAGIGLNFDDGNVVFRANFATLEKDGSTIIDRRAGRISEGTEELAVSLKDIDLGDSITASVYPATHHRAVVCLCGNNLSANITDTDPNGLDDISQVLKSRALDESDWSALRTAKAVNSLSKKLFKRLSSHPLNEKRKSNGELPANAMLMRGAGLASQPRNLIRNLGLSAAVISGEKTLHGLAKLSDFTAIQEDGFTAMADTDIDGKLRAAYDALKTHDLVYVHIKAPDIFAHSKDAKGKRDFIERFDSVLTNYVDDDLVIGISADHSTNSNTGNHCGNPVPSLIRSPDGRIDGVTAFSELSCVQGGLGRIRANGFLISMLNEMGVLGNYHPFDSAFVI